MRNGRKGFTLIELVIVIIVIGILMAIAAPMMTAVKVKAICSEASMGISRIRTAVNMYRLQFGQYPANNAYVLYIDDWLAGLSVNARDALALQSAELDGQYFSGNCYMYYCSGGASTTYEIYAFTDPTRWMGGDPNISPGGLSGETQRIANPPTTYGLVYVRDSNLSKGRFISFRIPKSQFPTN